MCSLSWIPAPFARRCCSLLFRSSNGSGRKSMPSCGIGGGSPMSGYALKADFPLRSSEGAIAGMIVAATSTLAIDNRGCEGQGAWNNTPRADQAAPNSTPFEKLLQFWSRGLQLASISPIVF
jgi:hypothetical protein